MRVNCVCLFVQNLDESSVIPWLVLACWYSVEREHVSVVSVYAWC